MTDNAPTPASQSDDALVEELARALATSDQEDPNQEIIRLPTDDHKFVWQLYIEPARAILPILHAREAAAKDELRRLLEVIWTQEYRAESPDWHPLPDLVGMITQIDNMYAGVRHQRNTLRYELAAAKADAERLVEALRACKRATLHGAPEPRANVREIVDEALATYRENRRG